MVDSYVCSGATMRCSMGTSQARLTVLPSRTVILTGQPKANISDHLSMINIAPFGRCRSLGFPATASATAAAHGKLTPMPCVHNTPFPWMGGKNDYIIRGDAALLKSSTCSCMWGGTISIVNDGQTSTGPADLSKISFETKDDWRSKEREENIELSEEENSALDGIQLALDAAGFIPGAGAFADLANTAIYAVRGDFVNAGLSLIAAVPGIGDAAAAAKIVGKGVKASKAINKGAKIEKGVSDASKITGEQFGSLTMEGHAAAKSPTASNGQPFLSITAKKKPSPSNTNSPNKGKLLENNSAQTPQKGTNPDSLKEIYKYKGNQPKPSGSGKKLDIDS